jgi:predicted permease
MWHDLRYSIRLLSKSRGFTALAVAVLAIGIGINTALFSVVYAIFFRPLPVHAPEELVYLFWTPASLREPRPMIMGYPHYEYFREHSDAFAAITGHWGISSTITADEQTDLIRGEAVFANYFDVLGVKPILGRAFRREEDEVSNPDIAVVISHSLWTRRFNSSPDVIGKQVRLSDWSTTRHATIVGVMGPGFSGASDPWTPSQYWVTFAQRSADYKRFGFGLIARLKPGVSALQAQTIVTALGARMERPRRREGADVYYVFPANSVRMPYEPSASVAPKRLTIAMTIVVGIVLLVTAANAAGMLMARGVTRSGELAVRLVLGATGKRVARQLLMEGVLLATTAGAIGLLVASWLIQLFRLYTPERFAVSVWLDTYAWVFTAALCLGMGIVISVAPALQSARLNLTASLPGIGTGAQRRVRGRLRYGVVIPQIALSLVLLLVAALHVRALSAIELFDLGYQTSNTVVLNVALRSVPGEQETPRGQAARARLFYRQLIARVQAVPGTTGVSLAGDLPLRTRQGRSNYVAVSHAAFLAGETKGPGTEVTSVSPGYFRTMSMALVAGRDFDERDTDRTPKVAIVSESLARDLWPGRNPIGRSVAATSAWNGPNQKIEWLEVVGVVNEVSPILQDNGTTPFVYLAMGQQWRPSPGNIVARFDGVPTNVVQQLKAAVSGADPFADVYRAQSMNQMVAEILYPRRLAAAILGASAVIALVLASVGLYGIVSYSVAQRVHEIGVRAALGAARSDILRLVIGEGVTVGAIGSAIGLALTYTTLRLTTNLFVNMPRMDVLTLATVPLALLGVVVLACYVPARRAANVDPMESLRAL